MPLLTDPYYNPGPQKIIGGGGPGYLPYNPTLQPQPQISPVDTYTQEPVLDPNDPRNDPRNIRARRLREALQAQQTPLMAPPPQMRFGPSPSLNAALTTSPGGMPVPGKSPMLPGHGVTYPRGSGQRLGIPTPSLGGMQNLYSQQRPVMGNRGTTGLMPQRQRAF